jgi:hypothetical protein
MSHRLRPSAAVLLSGLCVGIAVFHSTVAAEEKPNAAAQQAKLEAALSKMLSGATLEGSFTSTGSGQDSTKLSREKYTLGDVKKVSGEIWQIPARIEYGGKDITIPIALPIRWAGDTPIVTVDDLALPGFGTVSARVMFFEGHYAGYWKHGKHGGHLFGVIHSAGKEEPAKKESVPSSGSGGKSPAEKKIEQQRSE